MNNMHKKLTAIALSGMLVTAAGGAFAFNDQQQCGHQQRGHQQHGEGYNRKEMTSPMYALKRLNDLSDEQKTQLQVIRKETRTALRNLRDQMRDAKEDLRDGMSAKSDLESIRQLAQKQGELTAQMIVLRAEARNKINEVLSESQQQQLQTIEQSDDGFRGRDGGRRF